MTIDGQSNYVVGLNQIGLRRAGYDQRAILQVKEAYRLIYRSGLLWAEILRRLQEEFRDGLAAEFYPFLSSTKRGSSPSGACRPAPPSSCGRSRNPSSSCATRRGNFRYSRHTHERNRSQAACPPAFPLPPSALPPFSLRPPPSALAVQ